MQKVSEGENLKGQINALDFAKGSSNENLYWEIILILDMLSCSHKFPLAHPLNLGFASPNVCNARLQTDKFFDKDVSQLIVDCWWALGSSGN